MGSIRVCRDVPTMETGYRSTVSHGNNGGVLCLPDSIGDDPERSMGPLVFRVFGRKQTGHHDWDMVHYML
jgi:hypothetical protein